MEPVNVLFTDELANDLNKVLDYLWTSEMKDFFENPSEKEHIFESLRRLNEILPRCNERLSEDVGARLHDLASYSRHLDDMAQCFGDKPKDDDL